MKLRLAVTAILLAGLLAGPRHACPADAEGPGAPAELARDIHLLRGTFVPGRQPDGNSVLIRGPQGLIVVDTGRHRQHTQRIVDVARRAGLPVVAIVNTHWHLDHVGGNALLRREFPQARVYASPAIREAMSGFLADYRVQLEGLVAKAADEEAQRPYREELAILDAGPALYPDEPITRAGERMLAGRRLIVGLESHAVTAGDVWLFDRSTGILVAGDLVTLPAPFLDTACPARWKAALDRLARLKFKTLVPGHGAPMTPKQFEVYRKAFDGLLACAAASDKTKDDCTGGWLRDAGALVSPEEQSLARSLVDYYVDSALRGDPVRRAKLCGAS